MFRNLLLAGTALVLSPAVAAQPPAAQDQAHAAADPAAVFGAREDVQQISLSPNGTKVAFIAPGPGPATILYVADVAGGRAPTAALSANGKPDRLSRCFWVSDTRLVCDLYMVFSSAGEIVNATRTVAVDADGK